MHAAYFVKRRNRLRCFIVTGTSFHAPVFIALRLLERCFTNTGVLAHECGCVNR